MALFNQTPEDKTTPQISQNQIQEAQTTSSPMIQTPATIIQTTSSPTMQTQTTPVSKVSANDLIHGIQQGSSGSFVVQSDGKKENTANIIQERRFLSVRYKVYSLIVVVILLVIYSPVKTAIQGSLTKWGDLQKINNTIEKTLENQQKYKDQKILFEDIEKNKEKIISCINQSLLCDQLSENINKNLETIKTYIQLGNLDRPKMDVDEAKILKSINEYMLQKNILGQERSYNGIVTSIVIGTTEDMKNNIMKVPVSLLVSFSQKEDLLNFLNNIENHIFTDAKNNLDASILFRIDTIQYDIVNYEESQDVEILLSAYAYKGS